jgi:hypothetical protein
MPQLITKELLKSGYTYKSYRLMIDDLLAQGKTTGTNHSPEMLEYTKLNVHRMSRLDNTITINDELKNELKNLKRKLIWMVIGEAWCGDVAMNLPAIAKIAEQNENIDLRILLRDENPDIMNLYLTNGGKAIPVMICFDAETLEELGKWGPRPGPAQRLIKELIANSEVPKKERTKQVMLWYASDNNRTIQNEFIEFLKVWEKKNS